MRRRPRTAPRSARSAAADVSSEHRVRLRLDDLHDAGSARAGGILGHPPWSHGLGSNGVMVTFFNPEDGLDYYDRPCNA